MEGYINIAQCHEKSVKIQSKHPFFSGELIIKKVDNRLEFKRPTLGYVGKVRKGSTSTAGWRNFSFNERLPLGTYNFDTEESNEDLIVVNLNREKE